MRRAQPDPLAYTNHPGSNAFVKDRREGPNPAVSETRPKEKNDSPSMDSAVASFVLLSHLAEHPVTARAVREQAAVDGALDLAELQRAARRLEFAAELLTRSSLAKLPLPAAICLKDGRTVVLAARRDGQWVVQDPAADHPQGWTDTQVTEAWTGQALVIGAAATGADCERRRSPVSWMLPQLARHKGIVAEVLSASLVVQIFALATPLFTMVIIDRVLSTGSLTTLDVLIIALIAIAVFDLVIGGLRSILMANLSNRIDVDLATRMYRHLTRLPAAFFRRRATGDTVYRMRELETLRQFCTGPSLTAIVDLVFATVFIAVMFLFSVQLTLVVLAAMALMLLVFGVIAPAIRRRLHDQSDHAADNQAFLTESLRGVETIKALAAESRLQRQWEDRIVDQSRMQRTSEGFTNTLSHSAQFFNRATIAVTLFLGARMVIEGAMTPGQLIAFNMMVGRVMAPAMRIAQLAQQIQQARVAASRIADLLQARPEPAPPAGSPELPPPVGAICFQNVTFRYDDGGPLILDDVSFECRPGEVVGIVGTSGAGKTSLLRLLERLEIPESGRILVDGINTAQTDPGWLRRHMGVVTQEAMLFHRSVRENITLSDPSIPMEAVVAAARLAGADGFIREMPQAYESVIGEGGATLSAGQRQRVALARALVTDPRILILDEPTSALDAESEQVVQNNMERIVRGRTVFIAAHRLSTLRTVDRILTLEGGRLVENGQPRRLLEAGGRFAELANAQQAFVQTSLGVPA